MGTYRYGLLWATEDDAARGAFDDHRFYEMIRGYNSDVILKDSVVESDYDVKEEVEKFVWADYILFQHPVYWMDVPWLTKKYKYEVFSAGDHNGIYINDGRSRSDARYKVYDLTYLQLPK